SVDLPGFFMARYEVTVAQYREFVRDTGRAAVPETLAAENDHPVTNITWTDALAYARWLQDRLLQHADTPAQLKSLLEAGWQVSLPTEAQWEKAARGTDGNIYPWGNQPLQQRANFGAAATQPVGSSDCPECNFGLADMSGNVWELTRSPYQSYPYTTEDDRSNLSEDALWVMRGGSYADGPANVRAAVRGGVDPGVRNATIGFRLVLTAP
ncbi:MAG: formylglycine-generating enzyme family protein, partial [Gammaproteobacteria bacterium]|nr:formylglycine-generating enzyme family protein [Gammaproteobacteria bacterium]